MTTCQMSIELGAYVLHALGHDEDELVRRHVADCPLCQAEVRDLSFTVSLLSLLTPEHVDQIDELLQLDVESGGWTSGGSATDLATSRSRRPRRRALLAVAAALLAALAIPAVRLAEHPAATPSATVIHAADRTTHVRAAVTLAGQDSGTRVHLRLSGAYPEGWCSLVAHSRDGRTETAATWRADADGAARVAGTTAIPTSRLSELDVVTDTGDVLVSIPVHQNS
jgi:hypothetical protein